MLQIKYENDTFLAKGTFDWGIAGVFENKDFGDGNIELDISLSDIEELLEKNDNKCCWEIPFRKALANVPMEGNAVAKALENFYNGIEAKANQFRKVLNDYFLFQLVENLIDTGYPFWEVKEALLPGYDEVDEDIYDGDWTEQVSAYSEIYWKITHSNYEAYQAIPKEYADMPLSWINIDIEALIRKNLPMFNLDGLIASIKPEGMYFSDDGCFSIQFSDSWAYEFYCSAYEQFDGNLKPMDWHNF